MPTHYKVSGYKNQLKNCSPELSAVLDKLKTAQGFKETSKTTIEYKAKVLGVLDLPPFVVQNNLELFQDPTDLQPGDSIHILYHAKCMDGAAAAMVASNLFTQVEVALQINLDVRMYPVSYAEPAPMTLRPGHVFILDFSYAPEVLEELNGRHYTVTVIDHHLTAVQGILAANEDTPVSFGFVLSDDRLKDAGVIGHSGASLTALVLPQLLAPLIGRQPELPLYFGKFVWLARNHDLWTHDGNTEDDALALSYWFAKASSLVNWSIKTMMRCIEQRGPAGLVDEGRIFLNEKLHEIKNNIIPRARPFTIEGMVVPVCPCPKSLSSLTSTLLNKNQPFSVTYAVVGDHIEYSLRASKESNVNVAAIAAKFSGGGHARAAGWVSTKTPDELFQL